MSNPQSPELRRSEYGGATQQSREAALGGEKGPGEGGGKPEPTPVQNQTEDERRSGEASTTYDPES